MYAEISGYNPVREIVCEYDAGDEDYATLQLRFRQSHVGSGGIFVSVNAETPEMQALFAAIHSAINPAPSELPGEVAEYEAARKVVVCEDCGQAHG